MHTDPRHIQFYRALEDRFRGSRETIRERLLVYTPFLEALKAFNNAPTALDIGCGRGEWLEILREQGFAAQGVDLDEPMLAACRERGLDVLCADAIQVLTERPDNSLTLISGFHLVEHLPFEHLQKLMAQAQRVLQPGGLLIVETPNPENTWVSCNTFYLDPTHHTPLPPLLLGFMTEHYGFARHIVMRLQESPQIRALETATLEQVFCSASPDYAVVAQKQAAPAQMHPADAPFGASYGLTPHTLFHRFQDKIDGHEDQISLLQAENHTLNARLTHIGQTHSQEMHNVHTALLATQHGLAHTQAALQAIYTSSSWKLTAPLRTLSLMVRWLIRGTLAWVLLRPGARPRRVLDSLIRRRAATLQPDTVAAAASRPVMAPVQAASTDSARPFMPTGTHSAAPESPAQPIPPDDYAIDPLAVQRIKARLNPPS